MQNNSGIHLTILEPNAHKPGHYSGELFRFCSHMAAYDIRMDILTPFGFHDTWESLGNCEVHTLLSDAPESYLHKTYGYQWEFYKRAAGFIRKSHADIVHLWGFTSVLPCWRFVFPLNRVTRIATLKAVRRPRKVLGSSILGKRQEGLSLLFLKQTFSHFVVHTDQLHREALDIGIAPDQLRLIPTGIDASPLPEAVSDPRQTLGIPADAFVILSFGVQREEKGITDLLQLLPEAPMDVHLLVAGEDWTQEGIPNTIRNRKVADRVHTFLTYVPEDMIPVYFEAADAVAITHHPDFKGESGVLLHAIKYGKPLLTSSGSHAAVLTRKYSIGSEFSLSSTPTFPAAIELLKVMCGTGYDETAKGFEQLKHEQSWEKIAEQYYLLYQSLMNPARTD